MRSEDEQIDAILQQRADAWAAEQLPPGESMDDHQYGDFISVTPEQVVERVLARGFGTPAVWTPGDPPERRNDCLVVEPSGGRWVVYYVERGDRSDVREFDDRRGAVRDAVARLLRVAWIALNHRYWHRHHPELPRLPAFGQPWTPTGTPA